MTYELLLGVLHKSAYLTATAQAHLDKTLAQVHLTACRISGRQELACKAA